MVGLVAVYVILAELSLIAYIVIYIGIMMVYSGSIPLFINMGRKFMGSITVDLCLGVLKVEKP